MPDPLAQTWQVIARVTGLPYEMGKVSGEVRGVLTGAATDLEDVPAVRESASENLEDRALIALAGFGD
jgi:hypothetical protein